MARRERADDGGLARIHGRNPGDDNPVRLRVGPVIVAPEDGAVFVVQFQCRIESSGIGYVLPA